jgi:uncharacterized membrane protein
MPPDRARELYRRTHAKERRLNEEWRNRVTAWLRRLIGSADARVIVLVDEMALETVEKNGLMRRVLKSSGTCASTRGPSTCH